MQLPGRFHLRQQPVFLNPYHLIQSVQSTPQHKSKVGTVPNTAHQKGDKQIPQMPPMAHPIPPQRNIQIVLKPGRQRDMPSPPKLLDAPREIGTMKVFHQVESHNPRRAYGYERIPGKVAINLEGKEKRLPAADSYPSAPYNCCTRHRHRSKCGRPHRVS